MTGSPTASNSAATGDNSYGQDELVLVLDFGGQTAQLIATRVRDQSVF